MPLVPEIHRINERNNSVDHRGKISRSNVSPNVVLMERRRPFDCWLFVRWKLFMLSPGRKQQTEFLSNMGSRFKLRATWSVSLVCWTVSTLSCGALIVSKDYHSGKLAGCKRSGIEERWVSLVTVIWSPKKITDILIFRFEVTRNDSINQIAFSIKHDRGSKGK